MTRTPKREIIFVIYYEIFLNLRCIHITGNGLHGFQKDFHESYTLGIMKKKKIKPKDSLVLTSNVSKYFEVLRMKGKVWDYSCVSVLIFVPLPFKPVVSTWVSI